MMSGTLSPQITVEIRGADRCGKSVVGQLLRQILRVKEITVIWEGGEYRDKAALYGAINDLKGRGLLVEITEVETPGPIHPKHQIDARGVYAEPAP